MGLGRVSRYVTALLALIILRMLLSRRSVGNLMQEPSRRLLGPWVVFLALGQ